MEKHNIVLNASLPCDNCTLLDQGGTEQVMECPLGDFDLNHEQTDVFSECQTNLQDRESIKGQEDGLGSIVTTDETNAVQMNQTDETLKQQQQKHEEPEEGEISDDNDATITNPENEDGPQLTAERDDATESKKEPSLTAPTGPVTSYDRRSHRSNGHGRHGGWKLPSDPSPYSAQSDNFYQLAWAQGIQGSSKDTGGDILQEESKSRKMGDNSGSLQRSSSADRKTGWIYGDRGIEYVKLTRSEDGLLYLQEGAARSDQRRGDRWKSDRGSSERSSMSRSISEKREPEDKYRSHFDERTCERDHWRRSESRSSSRDSRKRRGEGDLEDEEFEPKQAMLADQNRHIKSRNKSLEKMPERSSNGKAGLESPPHDSIPDSQREKLFADVSEYVRNVAVKDAQKSFLSVCSQLRRALKTLRDLNRDMSQLQGKNNEGVPRKVLGLTRDAFSGIRAAYAVRSTAIGKEQEQDTNAFPRLLELARGSCQSLFTSKQIQELESMMQAIGFRHRMDNLLKSHTQCSETVKGEEKDTKFGESSANTSATTQVDSESLTDDSAANDRTFDNGDEAEQPFYLSVDLNIGEVTVAQPVSSLDIRTAGTAGIGGWFSLTPEQGDNHGFEDLKAAPIPIVVDLNEDQSKNLPVLPEMCSEGRRGKLSIANFRDSGQGSPHKDPSLPPSFDPVRAFMSYHEKFVGKSQTVYSRLPSPTPSDEERAGGMSGNETSGLASSMLDLNNSGQAGEESQGKGMQPSFSENSSHEGSIVPPNENSSRFMPLELTLFPSLKPAMAKDGSSDGIQARGVQQRGFKKSRDPRQRFVSQPFDLEVPQRDNVGVEGSERTPWLQGSEAEHAQESLVPRQQSSLASQEILPRQGNLMSLFTLATGGGWLTEQQLGSSSMDATANIAAADTVSRMILDSGKNLFDDSAQKKREMDSPSEDASKKRQKILAMFSENDVTQGKVSRDLETSAVGDEVRSGVGSERLSSTLLMQNASILESAVKDLSQVKDLSKPRMKPRDPRRALVGGILEKSKTLAAPAKSESMSAASSSGPNSNVVTAQVHGDASAASLSMVHDHANNKRLGIGNSMAMNMLPCSMVKSESNGMPQSFEASGRADDVIRGSKVIRVETKMTANESSGKFDLNVSAAAHTGQHWDHLEPLLEGLDERQKRVVRQERARRIDEQTRMFAAKKLCLVLDLDHTLLNSAKFTEIEGEWEAKLQANEATERCKSGKEGTNKRELYRFQHMGMWTKLRPGIWNFLARASHLYELHVYTMGNKAYATEMAKLLDPTGTLFAGRVISKGDDGDIVDGDERPPKSKDLDGVLGMESAVVIIDDSARVWPHHRHNLIVVERYMYFPCSRKQFGLPGPSLLEVGHDEREQDGMLASALTVIEKIHYSFFSNPRLHEVDVRDILAKEQQRVLAGCKLVFSRVFPQGEIQPHLHPLWQLAEQFGAVCSMGIDDGVTHVVAISLGTEKVNWALSSGRFVVRPSWLEASAILYHRASERDFSVPP